jgi:hypothetical protein
MWRSGRVILVLSFLLSTVAFGQQSSDSVTLKITEDATSYVLTVPISRLVMTIPKDGLEVQRGASSGAGNGPRYFSLKDPSGLLIVSGWFESADGFSDIQSFWRNETAPWKKKGLPQPRDVSFEHIGTWNAVLYDMTVLDATSANIRAHWVQSGTWIDVHLSLTGRQVGLREKLRGVLQSIKVTERAP